MSVSGVGPMISGFYINGVAYGLDYNALDNLPDLTKDSVPTEGSQNYITSGAVAEAIRIISQSLYPIADKTKLAGIEADATKTIIDASLSSSSNNAISNSAVTLELQNLARRIALLESGAISPSHEEVHSNVLSVAAASIDTNGIASFSSGSAAIDVDDNLVFSAGSVSLSE